MANKSHEQETGIKRRGSDSDHYSTSVNATPETTIETGYIPFLEKDGKHF